MKKQFSFSNLHIVGFVLAFIVAGYLYLVHSVMPKYMAQMLPVAETMAQDYINGTVKIGNLTWGGGLSAEVDNVVVKDLQGKDVAVLPKTKVHFRPWLALIKPARALTRVELVEPELWLRLDDADKWNLKSLMKPSESEETPFYGLLEVEKAKLNVDTPYGKWNFGVEGSVDGGANPKFALDTKIKTDDQELKVSGLATTKGVGKIQVNTEKLSFNQYAGLVKHYTNIEKFAGDLLKTHLLWENDGKGTTVSGQAEFADFGGIIKVDDVEQHSFAVNGNLSLHKSILNLERLDAVIDKDNKLSLHAKADLHDLDNIGAQGLLKSSKFAYKAHRIENLNLPFTYSKQLMQIDNASVQYGGGIVKTTATVDLRENSLTADLDLKNVSYNMSIKNGDVIHANGNLAVVGRLESKDDKKNYIVHAGADTFDLSWQDLQINKLALDGDFDGKKLTVDHFSAQTGDGVIVLKGSAVMDKEGALALDGRMSDFAIDPVLYHFANIRGKGLLSMNFKVGGTVASPEFGTMVQLRQVDVMDLKLQEMHGFVGMKDNVLNIKRMGATLTKGRHIIDGSIDMKGDEPTLNLDVTSRNVRVEPLVAVATKDFSLTGNLNNTMHISGSPKHPRVQGELNLTDGSVQGYLFNGISGKYLYDDGFVGLEDVLINLFVAQVQLAGTMTKEQKLSFDLKAQNVDVSKSPYLDKNLSLEGLMDIDGHIDGTVKAPTFTGNVASKKMVVNGEAYTEIAGNVASDMRAKNRFDVSFKQPHQTADKKAKSGLGKFSAKGNLNLVEKFLDGVVIIDNGDINGLLRTDKLDYAVNGIINGKVDICPNGKGSGILFNLNSNNIETHKLHYQKMDVNGIFKDNVLTLNNAILQENIKNNESGIIKAYGIVNLPKKLFDVHAEAVKANPAIVNVAMKSPLAIKGAMNLTAALNGSFDSPKGEAELEIVDGSFMNVGFDSTKAKVSLADDTIDIKELMAVKDVYSFGGKGKIPMDALRAKDERKNPDAQMDISLDFDNTRLGILTASKYVDWATGDMQGKLFVTGTLDEPLINGNLAVEDGTLKIKDMNSVFEHIQFAADFKDSRLDINKALAQIGPKGKLSVEGYYDLNAADEEAYKLNVKAIDAELSYSDMFKGVINSDLEITPQQYRDYWHSLSKVGPNSVMPVGLRPLIKGNVRLDNVLANVLMVADSEPGSETNLGLDLKVELGPKIHMLNAMFYDMWLSGGLDVKGGYYSQTTNNEAEDEKVIGRHNRGYDGLKINGKIRADKGNITYLRTAFKLTEAELTWKEKGDILPFVKLDSWSRFGKYRVSLRVDGSLSDVKNEEMLKLTSTPPMEKNTIIRMLTLQRESAGSNDVGSDDLNNVMNAGLQMAVLGNMEFWVKQTLGLDQFRVYTGKVNAGLSFDGSNSKKELTDEEKNRYNVLISKYVNDNLMLGYTTDVSGEEKVIFGQYDFGPHFNMTYSEKEKEKSKRERWFGLEYRIDFN